MLSRETRTEKIEDEKSNASALYYFPLVKSSYSPTEKIKPSRVMTDTWTRLLSEQINRNFGYDDEILSSSLESLKKEVNSCKECVNDLYKELSERPLIKGTSLYDIAEDLEVLEPIPIIIEQTEDECVVSVPEIEVFATGTGEYDAIIKLKVEIKDLYNELLNTPDDQLGLVPLSWKRILNRILRKNG